MNGSITNGMLRLVIGGSPCTHWSIAQSPDKRETTAEGLGWDLFLNYKTVIEKYKPDYFLYENNKSMAPAIRAQITAEFGLEPVLINSALVSAQNRQRLYWVGKREPDGTYSQVHIPQPADRCILLRDVLDGADIDNYAIDYAPRKKSHIVVGDTSIRCVQDKNGASVAETFVNYVDGKIGTLTTAHIPKCIHAAVPAAGRIVGRKINEDGHRDDYNPDIETVQRFEVNENPEKTNCITTVTKDNMIAEPVRVGCMPSPNGELKNSQAMRIYSPDAKAVNLVANGGGAGGKTGLYAIPAESQVAMYNAPHGFNAGGISHDKAATLTASGDYRSNHKVISPGAGQPIYEVKDGMITIKDRQYPIKLADGFYIIRKLTVLECKRLQTVPDDYIFPISDSQAYKCLGNGWTVDVIAHLMSHFVGITEKPVEVMSMYDGMSCGHIALDKLGANITTYYATEIDKYAIQATMANYPDTIQLGDAFAVRDEAWNLPGQELPPMAETATTEAEGDDATNLDGIPEDMKHQITANHEALLERDAKASEAPPAPSEPQRGWENSTSRKLLPAITETTRKSLEEHSAAIVKQASETITIKEQRKMNRLDRNGELVGLNPSELATVLQTLSPVVLSVRDCNGDELTITDMTVRVRPNGVHLLLDVPEAYRCED